MTLLRSSCLRWIVLMRILRVMLMTKSLLSRRETVSVTPEGRGNCRNLWWRLGRNASRYILLALCLSELWLLTFFFERQNLILDSHERNGIHLMEIHTSTPKGSPILIIILYIVIALGAFVGMCWCGVTCVISRWLSWFTFVFRRNHWIDNFPSQITCDYSGESGG